MDSAHIKKTAVLAVCGRKNSGKTTLIVEMVKFFREKNLKVAVIKHDGHDFACDVPGTDSSRFTNAGAESVAVYSKERLFVHRVSKNGEDRKLQRLIESFSDADLIIIEGAKNSSLPKVELLGREKKNIPVSNPKGRLFLVSDFPENCYDEKVLSSNDTEKILQTVYEILINKEEESYV